MPVLTLIVLALLGMGLFIALCAALYSALPRSLLDSAERHGRFHGLASEEVSVRVNGTPTEALPRGALSGQTA
jgi:hypothetical protein